MGLFSSVTHAVSSTVHAVTSTASDAVHTVEHAASDVAHTVTETASHVVHSAEHAARSAVDHAAHGITNIFHAATHAASDVAHTVEHAASSTVHTAAHAASSVVHAATHAASSAVHTAAYVANSVGHTVEHAAASAVRAASNAAHAVSHAASTAVRSVAHAAATAGHAIATGAKATGKFVVDHAGTLSTIATTAGLILDATGVGAPLGTALLGAGVALAAVDTGRQAILAAQGKTSWANVGISALGLIPGAGSAAVREASGGVRALRAAQVGIRYAQEGAAALYAVHEVPRVLRGEASPIDALNLFNLAAGHALSTRAASRTGSERVTTSEHGPAAAPRDAGEGRLLLDSHRNDLPITESPNPASRGKLYNPEYSAARREYTLGRDLDVVQLRGEQHYDATGAPTRRSNFFVRAKDAARLTPQELQDRFALDFVPDSYEHATLPAGTRIGVGPTARTGDGAGGGFQLQVLGSGPASGEGGGITFGGRQPIEDLSPTTPVENKPYRFSDQQLHESLGLRRYVNAIREKGYEVRGVRTETDSAGNSFTILEVQKVREADSTTIPASERPPVRDLRLRNTPADAA